MTGWSAVAGAHDFAVPDEARARRLAEALSSLGFPRVDALPSGDGWRVRAFDEGPYPVGIAGHRQFEAGGRAAARLARDHGGYNIGGFVCEPSRVYVGQPDRPISFVRPGSRPRVPEVAVVAPPPLAGLPAEPDVVTAEVAVLEGLDRVPWARLENAHGPASDIPELIGALADPADPDWDEILDELLADCLLHQGTCYSATAPAIGFLVDLVTSGALPAQQRFALCGWLLVGVDRWGATLIGDEPRAFAQGRPPVPQAWAAEVRAAVGEGLPRLLRRWASEPPLVRFVLACLAAHFPEHGRSVATGVEELARGLHGTAEGAYLELAAAVLRGDDEEVRRLAAGIVAWDEQQNPGSLEAPGIPSQLIGAHILGEAALDSLFTSA